MADSVRPPSHRGPDGHRPGPLERLRDRWQRTLVVLRAPHVRIDVYGGDDVRAVYRAFTARHRRFRFTSAKRWGVALLRLPSSPEEYDAKVSRQARRKRKRALESGYRHVMFPPLERVDEILDINRSTPSRQGRPMAQLYTERQEVVHAFESRPQIHGIEDAGGSLRAYGDVLDIGDAYTFAYLIGHADDLPNGVMYLLMSEIVRGCVERRRPDGAPHWLMADTLWGGGSGLAYFKNRTGFEPFTVKWHWVDRSG